jgi:hypothetical protein
MSEDRIPLLTPIPLAITPQAWYWIVGNRSGVVYSSSAAAYVATDDTAYTDWLALGNFATSILCDGELADVLATRGLAGAVVLNTDPTDWGGCLPVAITAAMQAAGVALTSTGTPALNAHYQLSSEPWATMGDTQLYINTHNQLPNNQPLLWPAYDGTVTFNTSAEFTAVYQGLSDYVHGWKSWAYHGGTMPTWGSCTIA